MRRMWSIARLPQQVCTEPSLVEEVHVGVEDVAAEGGVGEDVVNRAVVEVRELGGRGELVAGMLIRLTHS